MKNPFLDPTTTRETLNRVMFESLPPVLSCLAGIYGLLAVAHVVVLPAGPREVMVAAALGSAAILLTLRLLVARGRLKVDWASPTTLAMALIVFANSSLHMVLLSEPWQATNFLLLALGASFVVLDRRYFLAVLAVLSLGWMIAVSTGGPSELWGHFSIALSLAIILAVTVHRVSVERLLRLEGLHRRDVERQHELEEALHAAQASSRSKSLFLAHMSHELRTPLNAVIGFTNILRKNRRETLSSKDLQYLERIGSNGEHLLSLIDQLLDLSRIETGKPDLGNETVDLAPLLHEVVAELEPLASEKGLELDSEILDADASQRTDRRRLKQVLINLVGNGLKFTHEGRVTLRLCPAEGDHPRRIEVEDTGIGIPHERLETVFEAFEQVDGGTGRQFSGTGLGLTISRTLCEHLGFSLTVASTFRQGSVFTITLGPSRASADLPADVPADWSEPAGHC